MNTNSNHTKSHFSLHKVFLTVFFGAVLWIWSYTAALAADVLISPSTGSYAVGQTFTATVKVAPNGSNVNAVEAALKFDPKKLSVVSISKEGSAFSLWTTEPTFSNSAGTVTLGGGSPTPFTAQSSLVNITFRTVAEGAAAVTFSSASVLAADGRGTDVFSKSTPGSFTVTAATVPTTPTPSTPTPEETPKPLGAWRG